MTSLPSKSSAVSGNNSSGTYTWIPDSADNSCIAGIPMPPQNANIEVSTPRDDQTAAWEKAQEALKKVNVSATSTSSNISSMTSYHSQTQPDIHSQIMHYYPWMEQHSLGMSPFLPRLPPPPPPPPPSSSSSSLTSSLPPQPSQTYGITQENSIYVGMNYGFTPSGTHLQSANVNYHPDFMNPWASSNVTAKPRQFGFNGNRSTLVSGSGRGEYGRNNTAPQHPIRFSINRPRGLNTAPAFHQNSQSFGLESPTIPDPVKRYVERSYMAVEKKEDRDKLEEYFKQKLNPLLMSGAYKAVDWDREPLPSEVNFELKMGWTPASQLKKGLNAITEMEKRSLKKSKHEMSHRRDSRSPTFREQSKRRVPFSPRVRLPSDEDNPVDEQPKFKQTAAQKKKKKQKKNSGKSGRWAADERSNAQREERARRFARDDEARRAKFTEMRRRLDWYIDREGEQGTSDNVVGTCMDIEKSYFRLTSAPEPSTVRPLKILEKALKLVQQKYATNRDYTYANDQLRSIRQDLMIQCIRTDFTVNVYETNARIALEQGDREEFNQCQSQLKLLYKELPDSPNCHEFTSYRLLYYISVANTIDQTTLLSELDEKARKDPCLSFSLKTREAWALGNHVKLFRLYQEAPRMASYVMDLFLERERKAALNACLKSFRPTINITILASRLGLEEPKLCEWLATFGITVDDGKIDCRTYSNTVLA
ncbi:SAC3/GANP family protein [Brugia malayi]|uniref:BMA-HPO-10 n=4 Tax=Brugia TaxID=6278 RepID=A0A0K0J8Y3_BRUMA|nr:SAC3/GANP family protein [Brugia malayi]CTP81769.1 BMA-HPO-10 [Brugia malayi]VIO92514.1 SAC3/GANP family protein [Brugia malayi]